MLLDGRGVRLDRYLRGRLGRALGRLHLGLICRRLYLRLHLYVELSQQRLQIRIRRHISRPGRRRRLLLPRRRVDGLEPERGLVGDRFGINDFQAGDRLLLLGRVLFSRHFSRGRYLRGGQLGEELGHARLQRDAELGDRRRDFFDGRRGLGGQERNGVAAGRRRGRGLHGSWLGEGGPRRLDDGRLGLDPLGSLYCGRRLLGGQLGKELGHARLQRDAELGDRRRDFFDGRRRFGSHERSVVGGGRRPGRGLHGRRLGDRAPRRWDDGRLGLDPLGSLYCGRRLLGGQLGAELGHAR